MTSTAIEIAKLTSITKNKLVPIKSLPCGLLKSVKQSMWQLVSRTKNSFNNSKLLVRFLLQGWIQPKVVPVAKEVKIIAKQVNKGFLIKTKINTARSNFLIITTSGQARAYFPFRKRFNSQMRSPYFSISFLFPPLNSSKCLK